MKPPTERCATSRATKALVAFGLVAVYAMLYLRGLDFGRPICEHVDEWCIAEQGMRIAGNGLFHPLREYTYGSFSIFIQGGVCALLHAYNNAFGVYRDADGKPIRKRLEDIAKEPTDRDLFRFHLAGRVSAACYAAILFWFVYLLGKQLFASRWSACLCVLATMVNPLMVQQAHFVLPNVLASLLTVASIYCSILFLDGGDKRILYLGALLAGLAIGTKITMVWAFGVVMIVALLRLRTRSVKHMPFLMLVFAVTFVIVEPYIVFDAQRLCANFAREARNYSHGGLLDSRDLQGSAFGSETLRAFAAKWRLMYPVLYWFYQGFGYFVVTLAGLIFLPFLVGRKGAVALIFPACVFLFIGMQRKVLTTNYVPLIPFCALGLGSADYALSKWRERQCRFLKPLVTAGIVLMALLALAVPTRNSVGVVRQLTTKDPYQTGLEWIEKNVPRNAKVAAERGMLGTFPFSNDGLVVRTVSFLVFWQPYTNFLDQDYVVALTPGMYDRFPWFRQYITFQPEDNAMRDAFLQNRRLNEQRLILMRHITPEGCGYVPCAEMPLIAHDVYIYKVPKVTPVRLLPPESLDREKPQWNVTADTPVEVHSQLEAGHYDVFFNAAKSGFGANVPASLDVRVDDGPACNVHVMDFNNYDHFVSTIELDRAKDVKFRFDLGMLPHTANESIWLLGVAYAPVTEESIHGNLSGVAGPLSPRATP